MKYPFSVRSLLLALWCLNNFTAFAQSCDKPLNFKIEDVFDTRAKLRWTQGGTKAPLGWLVVYGPKGFVYGSTNSDTLKVTQNRATIINLQKKSEYDCYVVQQCDTNKFSLPVGPLSFLTYYTLDAGVSEIISPQGGCDVFSEKVKIRLNNYGADPLSLIPVRYSLNGVEANIVEPQDGLYTGVLGKDSSDVFEFDVPVGFQDPGEYLLAAYPLLENDEDPGNDTLFQYIAVRLAPPYNQNFDTWNGGWRVDTSSKRSTWAWGEPNKVGLANASSGKNIWVTNLQGPYNFDENSYLVSPCFDFEKVTEIPAFECMLFYDFEKMFDGAALEYTLNDGKNWQKLGKKNGGFNWYNETNTAYDLGDVWSGRSGGWVRARYLVPEVVGKKGVRFRFRVDSDVLSTGDGLAIDDVQITIPAQRDFSGLKVATTGDQLECGSQFDEVVFTFANFGTTTPDSFKVAYSINKLGLVIETVKQSVAPETSFTYTFKQKFDSRDGLFSIQCFTNLDGDARNFNNMAVYSVDHTPLPTPFQADFEAGTPAKWDTEGVVTDAHGNVSKVLAVEMSASNTDFTTTLPRYGLIQKGDTLRFDYRITSAPNGTVGYALPPGSRIQVQVSDNCASTYETVYTIDGLTHTPTAALRTVNIGLDQFVGRGIFIRFVGTSVGGNWFFDLDNVNLRACPASMNLSAGIKDSWQGLPTGSATVKVGAGNPPYIYKWSDGTTSSTNVLSNLGIGNYAVSVTDSKGCTGELTFKIGLSASGELANLSTLRLMPNPTADVTMLEMAFRRSTDLHLSLFNLQGQMLWQRMLPQVAAIREPIDLTALPAGVYILRAAADGALNSTKVIKY